MTNSKLPFILIGFTDIVFGIWGLFVSAGMFLLSAFIYDPNRIFTGGWALLLLVISLLAVVGGVFTILRKSRVMSLIGAIATVAPSLPFAAMIFSNFTTDEGFQPQTLLAFGGVNSIILVIGIVRLWNRFR